MSFKKVYIAILKIESNVLKVQHYLEVKYSQHITTYLGIYKVRLVLFFVSYVYVP